MVKAGKATVAVAPEAKLPVHAKVVGAPLSILYDIDALVKALLPRFLRVTDGVILPTQLSPLGLIISTTDASTANGGVQASEFIKLALSGLFSNTVRIRIFWSFVKIFIHKSSV